MTTLKKILTHIFVVVANFYLLAFFIGLFLMLWTVFAEPINMRLSFVAILLTLLISIIYQATRQKWNIITIGETIISNSDKSDILGQHKRFTITRIPIFVLIILTLALNGNLQDGLSEGQSYSLGVVFSLGLMFSCVYYGLKNFFAKPEMLPIFLISGGLLLIGFGYKYSPKARETGDIIFYIEGGLAVTWILVGLVYKSKTKSDQQIDNDNA